MRPKSMIRVVFAGLADTLECLAELLVEKPLAIKGKGPEEFIKETVRQMRAEEVVLPEDTYVPDRYTMYVCSELFRKYGRSLRQELGNQLAAELRNEMNRQRYRTQRPIEILLVDGKHSNPHRVEIMCEISECELSEEGNRELEDADLIQEDSGAELLADGEPREGSIGGAALAKLRHEGEVYNITETLTRIGRDSRNQIRIPSPYVSREHAEIHVNEGGFILRDLRSTNGTFVNGVRIEEVEIRHGDIIALDKASKIAFELEIITTYEVADSHDPREHFEQGVMLQHEKRLDDATKEYLEAIRLGMSSGLPHFNLGTIAFAQGDNTTAIGHFREGLLLEPGSTRGHADLGKLYGLSGEFDLAIAELEQALELEPEDATAQRRLTRVLEQKRIHELAEQESQERIALEPDELEREMHFAMAVQRYLLPKPPNLPGLDVAARTVPALGVTGDYYDFIPLGGYRVGVAIADVSGKGLAAALLMSGLRSHLRTLAKQEMPLADMMARINERVYEDTSSGRFITMLYGILDASGRSFTYCNAGHNYPVVYRASSGSTEELETSGLVAGVLPDAPYETSRVALDAGDVLLLYTDGITEAMNVSGECYDVQRLNEAMRRSHAMRAEQIVRSIYAGVQDFCGGRLQDDATALIVRAPL